MRSTTDFLSESKKRTTSWESHTTHTHTQIFFDSSAKILSISLLHTCYAYASFFFLLLILPNNINILFALLIPFTHTHTQTSTTTREKVQLTNKCNNNNNNTKKKKKQQHKMDQHTMDWSHTDICSSNLYAMRSSLVMGYRGVRAACIPHGAPLLHVGSRRRPSAATNTRPSHPPSFCSTRIFSCAVDDAFLWGADQHGAFLRCPSAAGLFLRSRCLLKDIRKGDRGDSRRLTFEERAERRSGKHREMRESREQEAEDLQRLVEVDFPDELQGLFERVLEKANITSLKVLNMARCLERTEIDVGTPSPTGGAGAARQLLPLGRVGQLVKVNSNTFEFTAQAPTIATAALQRLTRVDSRLQITKEGNLKLKIVVPPMTTQYREKSAEQIKQLAALFRQKAKGSRTSMVKILQSSQALDSGRVRELVHAMTQTYEAFVEEKAAELELMAEEVMLSSSAGEEEDTGSNSASGAEGSTSIFVFRSPNPIHSPFKHSFGGHHRSVKSMLCANDPQQTYDAGAPTSNSSPPLLSSHFILYRIPPTSSYRNPPPLKPLAP
eukprot:gene11641-8025_t